jgi:hypothetical protein
MSMLLPEGAEKYFNDDTPVLECLLLMGSQFLSIVAIHSTPSRFKK